MSRVISFLGILFFAMVVSGYSVAAGEDVITYEKNIKTIIAENCFRCHGSDSPTLDEFRKNREEFRKKPKGPRMDTYENLMIYATGEEAGALMRRVDDGKNTQDGKPGGMNKYLGKTDPERAETLGMIKKWIGGWTLKSKTDMTQDDLKAIKALEK